MTQICSAITGDFDAATHIVEMNWILSVVFSILLREIVTSQISPISDSLFEKDEVDSVQCLFWPDMKKHADFARYVNSYVIIYL